MGELIEKLNCCGGGPPKRTLQIKKKWKIDEINFDFLLFCCASRGGLAEWCVVGLFLCGLWAGPPANAPQRERERPQTHTTPTSLCSSFELMKEMKKKRANEEMRLKKLMGMERRQIKNEINGIKLIFNWFDGIDGVVDWRQSGMSFHLFLLSQLNNSFFLGWSWRSQRKNGIGWRVSGEESGRAVASFDCGLWGGHRPMLRKQKKTSKPKQLTHLSLLYSFLLVLWNEISFLFQWNGNGID